jgi:hypothetical protein
VLIDQRRHRPQLAVDVRWRSSRGTATSSTPTRFHAPRLAWKSSRARGGPRAIHDDGVDRRSRGDARGLGLRALEPVGREATARAWRRSILRTHARARAERWCSTAVAPPGMTSRSTCGPTREAVLASILKACGASQPCAKAHPEPGRDAVGIEQFTG